MAKNKDSITFVGIVIVVVGFALILRYADYSFDLSSSGNLALFWFGMVLFLGGLYALWSEYSRGECQE